MFSVRCLYQEVIAKLFVFGVFLPRSIECRRGLAMRILSVCLYVCMSVGQIRGL